MHTLRTTFVALQDANTRLKGRVRVHMTAHCGGGLWFVCMNLPCCYYDVAHHVEKHAAIRAC
jgi:hypothetical protein